MNESGQEYIKKEEESSQSVKNLNGTGNNGITGAVTWHFILKHLDEGTSPGQIKVNITIADVAKDYSARGVYHEGDKDMHFYISTEQEGKLNSAIANVKEQSDPGKAKLILDKIEKNNKSEKTVGSISENEGCQDSIAEPDPLPFSEKMNKTVQDSESTDNDNISPVSPITIILISLIFLFAVLFNVFIVEFEKYEINKVVQQQAETTAKLNERLENIKRELAQKNLEASELIDFHNKFVTIWEGYHNSIEAFSANSGAKSSSLDEVIIVTNKRLQAAEKYMEDFKVLKIPDILKNFYEANIAFIESDIRFWEVVLNYYNLDSPAQFDTSRIEELGNESKNLYEKANNELINIYESHGLSYFLKEYER